MKSVACIIARTNSSRLPRKVLREINGITLIEHIINKTKRAKGIDQIYLCTSVDPDDKILLEVAKNNGIEGYAGSRDCVIDRMLDVGEKEEADALIRITGDNIFTDEVYLDLMIQRHEQHEVEYTRTEYLPVGVTAEIIGYNALKRCRAAIDPKYSQYLMLYMFNPSLYKSLTLFPPKEHRHPNWSLTVDTPEDMQRTLEILKDKEIVPNYHEVCRICKELHPEHLEYSPSGAVKFPADVSISFDTYRFEMEKRIAQSQHAEISMQDFREVRDGQRV